MSLDLQSTFEVNGRVAVVTGGGTGIGMMITEGLVKNGARVYITGRRKEVLQKVAERWEGQIIPVQMDITNKESIMEAKKFIGQREGKIHLLVNNAGQVGTTTPFFSDKSAPEHKDPETLGQALFSSQSFADWEQIFAVDAFSIFFMTTAFLGLLAKGSDDEKSWSSLVVNITSISGLIKLAQDHFAYNTAKGAASHLTKMMSTEFALKNVPVRVNAIAPGVYESEMTRDEITPEMVDKIGKGTNPVPQARAGTAQEMAGTIVYLASRAGGYMNGQELVIDGGYVAVNPS